MQCAAENVWCVEECAQLLGWGRMKALGPYAVVLVRCAVRMLCLQWLAEGVAVALLTNFIYVNLLLILEEAVWFEFSPISNYYENIKLITYFDII